MQCFAMQCRAGREGKRIEEKGGKGGKGGERGPWCAVLRCLVLSCRKDA